jgi:lipopolysaccharide biosynthesis protein
MLKNFLRKIAFYIPFYIAKKFCVLPYINNLMYSRLLMKKNSPYLCNIIKNKILLKDLSQHVSIIEYIIPLHQVASNASFVGKKVALIAHWDPDRLVDPYVLYYLNALKNIGYITILISAQELYLSDDVCALANFVLWRKCPGYDFTSWKGAFEYYPSLFEAQEVLITNDSIFGPMHPLSIIHSTMDEELYDFWGLVFSKERVTHIQSYYIVFRSTALKSQAFKDFFASIDTNEDKEEVIAQYELGLTCWLQRNGLIAGAYMMAEMLPLCPTICSPAHVYWRQFLRDLHMPFLKRDIVTQKNWWIISQGWEDEVKSTTYPHELIVNYLQRTAAK